MSKKKLDYLGVSAFAESMAMMISSGVSVDDALFLMKQGQNTGVLAGRLDEMARHAEEGNSLESSMRKTDIFPEYALQMVAAGEKTGKLDRVLSHLADYYHNQKDIRDSLRSAVIYPASMTGMIIVVLAIMLALVLPAFGNVYADLTASSFGYLNFAYGICRVLLIVMIVLVVLLVGGIAMWNSGKKKEVEKLLRHIPVCADLFDETAKYRFTSAFGIYLASGEARDDAVSKCRPLADCENVEKKLSDISDLMDDGLNFSSAANKVELYEPIYGRMLVPAERSGNMEGVLKRLNDLLKTDITTLTSRIVNTAEPLLSGVLMISIGIVLISLMLPLIGMMSSMI